LRTSYGCGCGSFIRNEAKTNVIWSDKSDIFPLVKRKSKPPLLLRAARIAAQLKRVRSLTEVEKSIHAIGLAATPDERWEINQYIIRSLPPSVRQSWLQQVLESARQQHERLQNIR
jgi:hypothetical protein